MKPLPLSIATRNPAASLCARANRNGLTLLEVIVALAVLSLLLLALAQAAEHASMTVFSSSQRLRCDHQAEAVFERISADLRGIPARNDIDLVFRRPSGNDALYFISESPAYFIGDPSASLRSPLALMGYRVDAGATLLRISKGLTWEGHPGLEAGGAPVFLTAPAPTVPPIWESTLGGRWPRALDPTNTSAFQGTDVHSLCQRVARFEYCFEMRPGRNGTVPAAFSNQTGPAGSPPLKSIRALRLALVLMNPSAPALDPGTAAQLFPDPTDADLAAHPPRLMASVWEERLWTAVQTGAVSRGNGIRIYERRLILGGTP
jgi:prepilin-type N-terminal cleavage/methylation domain-containing protein